MIIQKRSKRKPSGAAYKASEGKRKYSMGRKPALTLIGEKELRIIKTKGNGTKQRLLLIDFANVFDKKTKKYAKAKIKTVTGNPANRFFIRRNILTKGAIIDTDKGKAKITSRPGQDGIVNAVLLE